MRSFVLGIVGGIYEQNGVVKNVSVDDWTTERTIIASNEFVNSDSMETTSYLNVQRLRSDNQREYYNKPVHFNRLVEGNFTALCSCLYV